MTEAITITEGGATSAMTVEGAPNGTTSLTVPEHFIGLPGVPEVGPDGKPTTRSQKRQAEKWLNETLTRKEAAAVFKRIADPYMQRLFGITSELELGSRALFNVMVAKGLLTEEEVSVEYQKLVAAALEEHRKENEQKVAEQKKAFCASWLGRDTDKVVDDIAHMLEKTTGEVGEGLGMNPIHVEFITDVLDMEKAAETPRPEVLIALSAYRETLLALVAQLEADAKKLAEPADPNSIPVEG